MEPQGNQTMSRLIKNRVVPLQPVVTAANKAVRHRVARALVEGLEDRRLLAADPGDTLATAQQLGTLPAGPQSFSDSVGSSDNADYYTFNVTAPTELSVGRSFGSGSPTAGFIGRVSFGCETQLLTI